MTLNSAPNSRISKLTVGIAISLFSAIGFCMDTGQIEEPYSVESATLDEILGGFTHDATITRLGHEFTRYLSERRLHLEDSGQYNLSVFERPSARWGNLLWVEYKHKTMFRQFVRPNTNDVQLIAENAANQIHENIKQEKLRALFSDTFDLDKDEY